MSLLDLLLPPACVGCGRFGTRLCEGCRADFRPPSSPDERFVTPDAGVIVGNDLELAVAAFAHSGSLRAALGRLKYAGASRVASQLASASAPALSRLLAISGPAAIVPVPLHAARRRERGFNQAALLAEALGRETGAPVVALLRRERATARQHGLDRASRLRNLAAAFRYAAASPPPPRVIVVDDILTTAATMESCAAVLRAAGAEHVFGFAVAREV